MCTRALQGAAHVRPCRREGGLVLDWVQVWCCIGCTPVLYANQGSLPSPWPPESLSAPPQPPSQNCRWPAHGQRPGWGSGCTCVCRGGNAGAQEHTWRSPTSPWRGLDPCAPKGLVEQEHVVVNGLGHRHHAAGHLQASAQTSAGGRTSHARHCVRRAECSYARRAFLECAIADPGKHHHLSSGTHQNLVPRCVRMEGFFTHLLGAALAVDGIRRRLAATAAHHKQHVNLPQVCNERVARPGACK